MLWQQRAWTFILGEHLPEVWPRQCVPQCHDHLRTRVWRQYWSGLICINPNGMTEAEEAICPRSHWKYFSGTAVLFNRFKHHSNGWAQSSERRAVIVTKSNSTPRKEMLCIVESLIFSQLTWSPNEAMCWRTGPCVCPPIPVTEVESASCQCS